MAFLLYLMTETYYRIQVTVTTLTSNHNSFLMMSLWGFLFGVLIEWKALYNLISGHIKVKWKLLIPTTI